MKIMKEKFKNNIVYEERHIEQFQDKNMFCIRINETDWKFLPSLLANGQTLWKYLNNLVMSDIS